MAPRRRAPAPKILSSGPWKGVRTTKDAADDPPFLLYDAINLTIPDPEGASGAYARPGLTIQNDGDPIVAAATTFRGQGVFHHTSLSNVTTNFVVMDGTLFRVTGNLGTYTDVSPAGITIDAGITTRVYGTSFGDQLIITDGVNRPWLASSLSATPIVGTYIDFDGAGTAWTAFGRGEVYGGSFFFILGSVGGVGARTDIAWSVPADAATGWQQPDYDFRWTLLQTAPDPLYALAGTNTQLYYWRRSSIGSISGTPGPDLQGSKTDDAISRNVGTISPQSVQQFGNIISFSDAQGRPYRIQQGASEPEPIWLQMRQVVSESTLAYTNVNQYCAVSSYDPTLNVVIMAPWSAAPSRSAPPVQGYWFDARTGAYFGRFQIGQGCQMDAMGLLVDDSGRSVLTILGSAEAPVSTLIANSGYVWTLNDLSASGEALTEMDEDELTTMGGAVLTTMGSVVSWQDNDALPVISATTGRMGYDPNTVLFVDSATALVGSAATVQVSAETAAVVETVEGTSTPTSAQDGINKITCGFSAIQGRGVTLTVSPQTATAQWNLQQITAKAIANNANPDEF